LLGQITKNSYFYRFALRYIPNCSCILWDMIFIIAIYIKLDFARKKVTIIKGIDEVKNNR